MQGLVSLTATIGAAENMAQVFINLDNGRYIVTASDAAYVSPWASLKPQNTQLLGFQIVADQIMYAGEGVGVHSEVVFECDSDTITGSIIRSDTSTEVSVGILPETLNFSPGQTELPFKVTFTPVNSGVDLKIERPSWAQRPGSTNR